MKTILTLVFVLAAAASIAPAQVLVSVDIMTSNGTAPAIGHGVSAYTVNIHVTGIGPSPVPFTLVRQNFPEVRLYSIEQGNDILALRVQRTWPARIVKYSGFLTAAGGIGITVEQKLAKSPSWLGPGATALGLSVPAVQAMITKDIPAYKISNPPPDVISLNANQGAEYTWLCARGTGPVTIPVRRIDPIASDPLAKAK